LPSKTRRMPKKEYKRQLVVYKEYFESKKKKGE
jgi:hypothetical protein